MNSDGLKRTLELRRDLLVCLGLAAATLAVYWQVSSFEFTNFDEFQMVLQNPFVLSGLTLHGAWWGLTTSWFEYWHPLTWWSHMLDCELFGLNAGGHHLMSVVFHVANTILVYVVLQRMTGAWKRSALVAALFALHPLHVESVAWIAERKDVLSAFFFLLTLWAYERYVRAESREQKAEIAHPGAAAGATQHATRTTDHASRITHHSSRSNAPTFYALSLIFFACGLMSKPMLVTLPFVLLLLDFWPLRRFGLSTLNSQLSTIRRLFVEKLPFFALSVASGLITYFGARAGGNILSAAAVPWGVRLENVPVSYARYLVKLVWPVDLIALYPMPKSWPWWEVAGATVLLIALTVFFVRRARSAPYGIVGWLLFLGVLLPTVGLVQVGSQSIADRYTYIPYIGLFIAVVWGAADWLEANAAKSAIRAGGHRGPQNWQPACSILAAVVLLACGYLSWRQVGTWRNSLTLWNHCLKVSPDNLFARYNLGYVLQHSGKTTEAIEQYRAALRVKPDHVDANLNLGIALMAINRSAEATNYLATALRLKPDYARAQGAMGLALYQLGDYTGALDRCSEAIRLDPEAFGPYVDMGRALSAQGKSDDALRYYAEGLRLNPRLAQTHYYLGLEWMKRGEYGQAVGSFGEAVRLAPNWKEARDQWEQALVKAGRQ